MGGILFRLWGRLIPGPAADASGIRQTRDAIWVYLKCNRCGEKVALRLRKTSEIQREYGDEAGYDMFINKVAICNKCFQRMNLRLEFDRAYRVINKQLEHGGFITPEEYEKEATTPQVK